MPSPGPNRRQSSTRLPRGRARGVDALLAATAEHIARLHDHPLPAWVNEPARFLDRPWVLSGIGVIRRDAIRYAPAAFIRHGALPDPKDLDARGGERHAWLP